MYNIFTYTCTSLCLCLGPESYVIYVVCNIFTYSNNFIHLYITLDKDRHSIFTYTYACTVQVLPDALRCVQEVKQIQGSVQERLEVLGTNLVFF